MRNRLILLIFLIASFQSRMRAQSSIINFEEKSDLPPYSGNTFFYKPSKGITLPEVLKAKVAYYRKGYVTKTFVMDKQNDEYRFSCVIPDSTDVILVSIFNQKGDVFDNNADKGFTVYPLINGKRYATAEITKADLVNGFADYNLKLKYPDAERVKMFEAEFSRHPSYKQGDKYLSYLYLLYKVYPQKAAARLLSFAKDQEGRNASEADLVKASRIYHFLKAVQQSKAIDARINQEFPKGELAKRSFWKGYYAGDTRPDAVIEAGMSRYRQQFGDIEPEDQDHFFRDLITNRVADNDSVSTLKTAAQVKDKTSLANLYNSLAWQIATTPADTAKLNLALLLSAHSLGFITDRIAHPLEDDDKEYFVSTIDEFLDTYALLLFKTGKYEQAFFYQDNIFRKGNMNMDGKERYALFAEKAKGLQFAMQFLEDEVQSEGISPGMLKQLEDIYTQLNMAPEKYVAIKLKADLQKKKNTAKMIADRFGGDPPKDFHLMDLAGRRVSLSDFKNKIVVLDFWATWCGPCRASFPSTQEFVNKYKQDPEVVFLFIDTWENKNRSIIQKNALAFIKKNNYTFSILFDDKNEVFDSFKVEGIPAIYILDKNHHIVYIGDPSEKLGLEIESAKNE